MPDEEYLLDDSMNIRVYSDEKAEFMDKSMRVAGKPYQFLLREIMKAFNEDRLRIIATKDQSIGGIYVTRTKS